MTIAEMPRYEEYKESRVEWLGAIPNEWETMPLKRLCSLSTGLTPSTSDQSNYEDDPEIGYPWIRPEDIDEGSNATEANKYVSLAGWNQLRHVSPGSTLICCIGTIGKAGFVNKEVSTNQQITSATFNHSGGYYFYLIKASQKELEKTATGNVLKILNSERLGSVPFLKVSECEMVRITTYLDKKTAQIDEAIAIKQQQITLLKERKQIIIQQAVTRGLDPDVPMKDSGVDWIGEIPKGWEVLKLKHTMNLSNKKAENKESSAVYLGMESVASNTGALSGVVGEADGLANVFNKGDILFGKLRPYLAKVYLTGFSGLCSTEFLVLAVNHKYDNEYASSLLLSDGFIKTIDASTYGSKMPRANSDFILNLNVPIPPIEEQAAIAKYIESFMMSSDEGMILLEQQITHLKEYKTTLINSAVTGKIKITPDMVKS